MDRLTPEREALCLLHDPFETDKGDDSMRRIDDVFVWGRRAWQCDICMRKIRPNERQRVITEVDSLNNFCRARICLDCCEAMALYEEHATDATLDAVVERYELGYAAAREATGG